MIDDQQAIADIELNIDSKMYKTAIKEQNKNRHLFICVDISGSMSSIIRDVNEQVKSLVQRQFEETKFSLAPQIVYYDTAVTVINRENKAECLQEMNAINLNGGGTDFSAPLRYILS